jgi:hypothetical protein
MSDVRVSEVLRRGDVAWVIAVNAIPVFAVIVFGWQALPLFLFYWIENVVVGILNVFKIVVAGVAGKETHPLMLAFHAIFFVVHYGLFCLLHGAALLAMFVIGDLAQSGGSIGFNPVDMLARAGLTLEMDSELIWATALLLAVHGGKFFCVWMRRRQWQQVDPGKQMFEPYGRLVVLHLTLIVAAIPVIALGAPVAAVLAMSVLKCGLELGLPQYRILVFDSAAR